MRLQPSATVERVLRGQLCTGCGLCASVSDGGVEMRMVAPGYARPHQSAGVTAEAERAIAAACPGAKVAPWDGAPWNDAPNTHESWGPYRQIATGHALDPDVRFQGSSGGAISALLIHALRTGLVDRVLHVAADPERPTRNVNVWSRTPEEVLTGAGSRYTASSPLASINQALSEGGRFAFVGKPCDVSALRQLGRVDPRVQEHVPLALSFFCGGVPAHDGVERILQALGTTLDDVKTFRFRGEGWPGTCKAVTHDGRERTMSYNDSWGGHLSKQVQFRCKICPDAVGGAADVACADAWYGDERGYPSFEEQEGRSLIVARTGVGERFLADAVAAGAVATEPLSVDQIDLMQPYQARRKHVVRSRTAALELSLQPKPDMRGLRVGEASRQATIKEHARNMLGTLRRIVLDRR
jgi:coenzyme F420 hydrogenase subunit beta